MLSFKVHFTYCNVYISVTDQINKSYAVGLGLALTTYPNISLRLRMTIVITLLPTLYLHVTLLRDIFIQLGPLVVRVKQSRYKPGVAPRISES